MGRPPSRVLLLALLIAAIAAAGLFLAISTRTEAPGSSTSDASSTIADAAPRSALHSSGDSAPSGTDAPDATDSRVAALVLSTRTLVLSGTVADASSGIAVPEVDVRLTARSRSDWKLASARSDAQGRYSIELAVGAGFRWDPDAWTIDVAAEGDRIERLEKGLWEEDFRPDPQDPTRFLAAHDLGVELFFAVRGRLVRESDGRPIAGGFATLLILGPPSGEDLEGLLSTETDETGHFMLRVRGETSGLAVAACASGLAPVLHPIVLDPARVVVAGDLVLGEGACIEGTVTTADGSRPIVSEVFASTIARLDRSSSFGKETWAFRGDSVVQQDASAPIGPDGRFRLCGLAPEKYFLTVVYPGCSLPSRFDFLELPAPATDVRLVITRGVYRVNALDARTGSAVAGAQLRFEKPGPRRCELGGQNMIAADPGAEYSGRIVAQGYRELPCTLPALVPNEVRDLEFRLEPVSDSGAKPPR